MKLFAGLEGGASHSQLSIIDESGALVYSRDDGPPTNHWLIGIEKCVQRIAEMLALSNHSLNGLCACLSGCEDQESRTKLTEGLQSRLGIDVIVTSDIVAPLAVCGSREGVVLISGTGSNCMLFAREENWSCGGWGHVLGDEGSGYWIARQALKAVVRETDNYLKEELHSKRVSDLVFRELGIRDARGLLPWVYNNFDKSRVASLCRPLASLAESGDSLAKDIFRRAGQHLGRHLATVLTSAQWEGEVSVACVGSVFKSWELLSEGFFSELNSKQKPILKRVKSSPAMGAALLMAREKGFSPQVDTICEELNDLFTNI